MADVPAPTLRPARPADDAFRFHLYASTRAEEMTATGWPAAQQESFLRAQFAARQASYRASFPDAQHEIVLERDRPIGALIVHRAPDEIRLVDIALAPEHRGRGLGTRLLEALLAEATAQRKPLRLHVLPHSPAARLYARLGFAPLHAHGPYLKMERRPPAA